jgi:hypothetical protein
VAGARAGGGDLRARELGAIPALSVLFVVARMAFWFGYLRQALLRAPGMGITIQINVVMLVWCAITIAGRRRGSGLLGPGVVAELLAQGGLLQLARGRVR